MEFEITHIVSCKHCWNQLVDLQIGDVFANASPTSTSKLAHGLSATLVAYEYFRDLP